MTDTRTLLKTALDAAHKGGVAIMEVYRQVEEIAVETKADNSPLTLADTRCDDVIKKHLDETGIPVLSEEGKDIPYAERKTWSRFWVVDPLDGTKEFIKRNGEFTVNIALVEDGKPVLGVVYAPDKEVWYFASAEMGSFKQETKKPDMSQLGKPLQVAAVEDDKEVTVVASRSHINEPTQAFIDSLKQRFDQVHIVSRGSSLKLCMVAEGVADIYPRFGPTMEWDTAAGQVVVEQAGGKVVQTENHQPLQYNKQELLNPWFFVKGDITL